MENLKCLQIYRISLTLSPSTGKDKNEQRTKNMAANILVEDCILIGCFKPLPYISRAWRMNGT